MRGPISAVLFGVCVVLGGCRTSPEDAVALQTVTPGLDTRFAATGEPNRLGRYHLAAGNHALAERHFRDAVEKNDADTASWIGLAAAYDNLSRFDLADRAYARAEQLGGETLEILNNRGYSYMLRGDGRNALAKFGRALEVDPGNPVILNNMRLLRLGERPTRASPL